MNLAQKFSFLTTSKLAEPVTQRYGERGLVRAKEDCPVRSIC